MKNTCMACKRSPVRLRHSPPNKIKASEQSGALLFFASSNKFGEILSCLISHPKLPRDEARCALAIFVEFGVFGRGDVFTKI